MLGIAALLVGCSSSAGSPIIDGVVEDFDAGSLGEIHCQNLNAPPDSFGQHSAEIIFSGVDSLLLVIERLELIGFDVDVDVDQVESGSLSFDGREGVIGFVTAMHPLDYSSNYDAESVDRILSDLGCEPIPGEGLIAVSFNERPE